MAHANVQDKVNLDVDKSRHDIAPVTVNHLVSLHRTVSDTGGLRWEEQPCRALCLKKLIPRVDDGTTLDPEVVLDKSIPLQNVAVDKPLHSAHWAVCGKCSFKALRNTQARWHGLLLRCF